MKVLRCALIAAVALIAAGCQGQFMEPGITASSAREAPFMREYGESPPPVGYVAFCQRTPEECRSSGPMTDRVVMTADRWVELNSINTLVNRMVEPATDELVEAEVLEVAAVAELDHPPALVQTAAEQRQ